MEIVRNITEPNLVWNIFTYVAESPITKEKRKQLRELGTSPATLRNLTQVFLSGKLTPEKTPDDLKEFLMEWKLYCYIGGRGRIWFADEPISLSPYFSLIEPDTYIFAESNEIDRELYESWAENVLRPHPFSILPLKIVPVRFWAFMRDDDLLEDFDVREYLG